MKAKDVYTEKYINYFKDTLTRLMATPSPSGYFREVNALLTELAQKENARCTVSPKGTCEIFIQGKGKETVGLSAHCGHAGSDGKKRVSFGRNHVRHRRRHYSAHSRRRVLQGAHARRQDVYRHVFVAKPRHTRVRRLRDKEKGREKYVRQA